MNQNDNNGSDVWQQAALNQLDSLYGFAIALTHSAFEADDLVQETYLHAAGHYGQLRPDSNLKGWLFTIMRNVWLHQLRHVRCGPEFVALDDDKEERWITDTTDGPQAQCIRIWEREEIRVALGRLPSACREIIVLRDIEGFSYKEIAEILDCPLGTIMSRLARARARLKRVLRTRQISVFKQSDLG